MPKCIGTISLLFAAVMCMTACGDRDIPVRHYQEIIVEAPPRPASTMPDDDVHASMRDIPMPLAQSTPRQDASFAWTTPDGWREEAGFGMRLVTLWIDADNEQAECTLIVLSGDVGGLAANIARWMDQVRLPPLSDNAMRDYIAGLERFETAGGLTGVLIDFDPFVTTPDALSTLAGIIERGRETLFVKLTGSKALLAAHRDEFLALCKSIK